SGNRGVEAGKSGNVALWTRQVRHDAVGDRIGETRENDRYGFGCLLERTRRRRIRGQYQVRRKANQFDGERPGPRRIAGAPANVETNVAAFNPVQRSEEHTSELESLAYLVCRLLLEKKNAFLHSDHHSRPNSRVRPRPSSCT